MRTLYHYTCSDSSPRIIRDGGLIVPRYQPGLGRSLVWMTDDPHATRAHLGLSSTFLGCDRMAQRFIIQTPDMAVPWNDVRAEFPRGFVRMLEAAPGTHPARWWVSLAVQSATHDASYPQA